MAEGLVVRRGNNYGFKKIEAPQIYFNYETQGNTLFVFPTSLFPNKSSCYHILATAYDTNGSALPVGILLIPDTNLPCGFQRRIYIRLHSGGNYSNSNADTIDISILDVSNNTPSKYTYENWLMCECK